MQGYEQELRLLLAIALNGAVLASAWRFAGRRLGGTLPQRWIDTLLLYYLVQYISIGLLGIAGVLTLPAIAACGFAISVGMWVASSRRGRMTTDVDPPRDRLILSGAFLFVLGYVGALVYIARWLPPMASDPLTYHLPAAVQWLQTGRLGLFETWFYNPANTYSPLAGSMFIAWLMAPLGNDVMARFVEVGPLLLIFWALVEVCRRLGASVGLAALVGLAAVVSRPFISQISIAKDDLFVSAFFLAGVVALVRPGSDDRTWSAVRFGIAVGLLLATKVTALLAMPIFLVMADAPFRAGWRYTQWLIAIGSIILLTGPWYLRNWVMTGNPLYPTDVSPFGLTLFEGMFTVRRSEMLAGARGWRVLTGTYFSMPLAPAILLIAGWCGAIGRRWRGLLSDPLVRVCIVGPIIGIALFLLVAPYAEVRFVYPSFLLLFACAAAAVAGREWVSIGAGAIVAGVALFTGFVSVDLVASVLLPGLLLAGVGTITLSLWRRSPIPVRIGIAGAIALVPLMIAFVNWNSFVQSYRQTTDQAWLDSPYGELAEVWVQVRNDLPPDATLAVANDYLLYPLYGFDLDRPLVYAPTRPGVRHVHDLPHFAAPTPGENIIWRIVETTIANPDRATWLANLRASGAEYLMIHTRHVAEQSIAVTPPELIFVREMPEMFEPVISNGRAVIYRIKQ